MFIDIINYNLAIDSKKFWIKEDILFIENVQSIKISHDLEDDLWTMAKWEFFYSKIKNARGMNPTRRNNMLNKIEQKLKPILISISKTMLETYEWYIRLHDTTDLKTFTEERYISEFDYNPDNFFEYLVGIFNQFSMGERYNEDIISEYIVNDNKKYIAKQIKEYIPQYTDRITKNIQEEKEKNEPNDDNIKDMEKNLEFYKNFTDDNLYDVIDMYGGEYTFLESLINYIYQVKGIEEWNLFIYMIIYNLVVNYLAPNFNERWPNNHEVVKKVKYAVDLLKKVKGASFYNAIRYIHIALNTGHNTGSMVEWLQEHNDISSEILDDLSDPPQSILDEWNDEFVKMGIF